MLSREEAQLNIIDRYIRVVIRDFAGSESFNPSMSNTQLAYMADQFTRDGLAEGFIPQKEASAVCDSFVTELRALVDKTLKVSPAAFEETSALTTGALPTSLADVDTHMDNMQEPRVSPPFVYPASGSLQQQWNSSPPFSRHPATFSSPTPQFANNAKPSSGSGGSEEDEVEMELELWESASLKRGKPRSPERNRFNVRAVRPITSV